MKKFKDLVSLVLVFVLCMAIQGCKAKEMYSMNTPWKMQDNSFSITSARLIDTYSVDSSTVITPTPNCVLLVISCKVTFSDSCKLDEIAVYKDETESETYTPFEGPYQTDAGVDYLFNIPKGEISNETIERYRLQIRLSDNNVSRTCLFVLDE